MGGVYHSKPALFNVLLHSPEGGGSISTIPMRSPQSLLPTLYVCRILGTPTNETWPGVTDLPDYKPSFPHWNRKDLNLVVPGLGNEGCDLLAVSLYLSNGRSTSGSFPRSCKQSLPDSSFEYYACAAIVFTLQNL